MNKIAVAYWSNTGNTQEMGEEIVHGVEEAGGKADMMLIDELDIDAYDIIAFGCPASGQEALNTMFRASYTDMRPLLKGHHVALFGSYGWGGGIWMTKWVQQAKEDGMILVADPIICKKKPDEETRAACRRMGMALATIVL